MQHIDTLRTLAIGSAVILAIGTTACASDEESDEKGALATVEASEGTADETSPPTEEAEDEETSEAKAE